MPDVGLKFTSNSLLCSGMLNVLTSRLCKLKWTLYFCIDGFQMLLKHPISGEEMHNREAAIQQTFQLFHLSTLMVTTQCSIY